MSAEFLNIIVAAFLSALSAGFAILHPYAFGLIGVLGTLAFLGAMLPHITSYNVAGVVAAVLAICFYLAVMLWLAQNIQPLFEAFLNQFLAWGAAVSGGTFAADSFRRPSSLLDAGFTTARPVFEMAKRLGLVGVFTHTPALLLYLFSYLIIVFAFAWAVKDVIVAFLEAYVCLMSLPVLLPWATLSYTASLFQMGVGWALSCCVRLFLTSAVLGIGLPLFSGLKFTLTPGGDETIYSALVMAIASVIFAVLVHQVAARSSMLGARGTALGIPGSALVPSGIMAAGAAALSGGWGAVAAAGGAAVRGASKAIQAHRGGGGGGPYYPIP